MIRFDMQYPSTEPGAYRLILNATREVLYEDIGRRITTQQPDTAYSKVEVSWDMYVDVCKAHKWFYTKGGYQEINNSTLQEITYGIQNGL